MTGEATENASGCLLLLLTCFVCVLSLFWGLSCGHRVIDINFKLGNKKKDA